MAQNTAADGRSDMEIVDSILQNVRPKIALQFRNYDGTISFSPNDLPDGHNY